MSNKTKQTLLKVARELLDSKGIEKLSMRELGRRAELSRTAMYRHFDNKQSMLAAIAAEDFKSLLFQMTELQKTIKNPMQFVSFVLKSYYQFAMENEEHYHLMFNTKWDNKKYPELRESAFSVFKKTEESVNNAKKEAGVSDPSSKKLTAILYAFIHGLVQLHLCGHNEDDKGLDNPEALIDQLLDALFQVTSR